MKLLTLSAADLRAALSMRQAVDAMKAAFAALSAGEARAPLRTAVPAEEAGGVTLLMGACLPAAAGRPAGLAAKVVSAFPRNASRGKRVVNGLVLVLDPATGEPAALADGTFLTAWRTGAASGAATDLLARPDAKIGALFGCGAQARTQALAVDCVRQLETLRVVGPRPQRVASFIEEMQPRLTARLVAAASAAEAVAGADVVCTATTSATPVFDGELLAPGAHVNGVGSYTLEMQEVDAVTVARSRVFVDSLEGALAEAGDLVVAERQGHTHRDAWTELGLVAAGRADGRRGEREITFFKSVGHAVQDVAAAARALEAARQQGLGREIEL